MIRCIAIDDEPLALAQITAYIRKVPFLELVASCRDAFSAMEVLSHEKADLIYIDINMPDLNGLDFVRSLSTKPIVVFTTAYSEYALEGFRVDALDYLLKPFSYTDFLRSANKVFKQFELMKGHPVTNEPAAVPDSHEHLFVKADYKIVKIKISDIKYIESQNEYVRIHILNEAPVMTLMSLKTMEERLSGSKFIRVHRSYIVNLNLVKEISRAGIVFDNKITIPVGEQYRDNLTSSFEICN